MSDSTRATTRCAACGWVVYADALRCKHCLVDRATMIGVADCTGCADPAPPIGLGVPAAEPLDSPQASRPWPLPARAARLAMGECSRTLCDASTALAISCPPRSDCENAATLVKTCGFATVRVSLPLRCPRRPSFARSGMEKEPDDLWAAAGCVHELSKLLAALLGGPRRSVPLPRRDRAAGADGQARDERPGSRAGLHPALAGKIRLRDDI